MDSWDLASSVGATATMVAAARALASIEPDPLITDPYAAPLVHEVGIDFFSRLVDGAAPPDETAADGIKVMVDMMAVRTRFFDDFYTEACWAAVPPVRQAVILASGLDARAYRLDWPAGTVVFELDQPAVIAAKTAAMAKIGAEPTARLCTVAVDLRDDWPKALHDNAFDPSKPTAWIAEGLLMYLPPEAQDRLFDNITALSAPGSRLATEYHPDAGAGILDRASQMSEHWSAQGLDLNMADLFYTGERASVVDYLTRHGWQVSTRTRPEMFALHGRVFPDGDPAAPLRNSLSVTAIRT